MPTRWSQTVQVMLEKDSGSPLKTGHIHPSAHGSVPHRTAQDEVIEKTITLDMMRLTKTNGEILDCDAQAC